MIYKEDTKYLKEAIQKSREAIKKGGFPVGALIVKNNNIISFGLSNGKIKKDATLHAEIDAIRKASKKLNSRNLPNTTLYSSLEPCLMCFSATYWAYIPRIVYACRKKKVSRMHYEGTQNLDIINKNNNRKIELVHISELEKEAFDIIKDWEEFLKR